MFKEFFSLFRDLLVLNMFKHVPLRAQAPYSALVSRGRERGNPVHVVQNFFLLKLVTLSRPRIFK
jgi:hypothetical protein